ncbi:MAG TPA: hypothetical protein VND95_05945 [Stellaceae bacterium]|nr:hypothetical protein [Stellaceae bacterium]
MRVLFNVYLIVGFLLLLGGLFATGSCPAKNTDMLSNLIFIISWPGYLYKDVLAGSMSPVQWLHTQACGGGVVIFQ